MNNERRRVQGGLLRAFQAGEVSHVRPAVQPVHQGRTAHRDAVLAEMAWVAARKPDILVCEATTFMDSTLRMVYGRTDAAVAPS